MPLFRRWTESFGKHRKPINPNRQLARFGPAQATIRANDVTEIQLLDHSPLFTELRLTEAKLEMACLIAHGDKRKLSHVA